MTINHLFNGSLILLASFAALAAIRTGRSQFLWMSAGTLFAGFTGVSFNAGEITIVPLAVCWIRHYGTVVSGCLHLTGAMVVFLSYGLIRTGMRKSAALILVYAAASAASIASIRLAAYSAVPVMVSLFLLSALISFFLYLRLQSVFFCWYALGLVFFGFGAFAHAGIGQWLGAGCFLAACAIMMRRPRTRSEYARHALRVNESHPYYLFDTMREGFALFEILYDGGGVPYDYRILEINPAFELIVSLNREKVIGKTLREILPGIDPCWLEIFAEVCRTGQPRSFDRFSRLLNKYLDVFASRSSLGRFAVIFSDITERKRVEQALKRDKAERTRDLVEARRGLENAKRLSDIGTLAATVAHELRNPLAAIQMAVSNIERKSGDTRLRAHIVTINKKLAEGEQIISNLLFYSRLKRPHFAPANMHDILSESVGTVTARLAGREVNISLLFERGKEFVAEVDFLQMKEVFVNLLNNAIDAIPTAVKGKIEISAVRDKKSIVIAIRDNGIGMADEVRKRVFEAFFTTKSKGTGLGLSVCWQIIKLHKGMIRIKSGVGTGTVVTVRIPGQGRE